MKCGLTSFILEGYEYKIIEIGISHHILIPVVLCLSPYITSSQPRAKQTAQMTIVRIESKTIRVVAD